MDALDLAAAGFNVMIGPGGVVSILTDEEVAAILTETEEG